MSETQTPKPPDSATARAASVMCYLRSVIRSGEIMTDAEFAVADEAIAGLEQTERERAELVSALEALLRTGVKHYPWCAYPEDGIACACGSMKAEEAARALLAQVKGEK